MDPIQIAHLRIIQKASQTGRLVVFVGAGVSNNSGVPTWNELINEMKEELPESISNDTDDLKVAQAYKDDRGEKEYLDKVKKVLRHNHVIPNPIHQAIFDLNPSHVVTTNYDDLLEQELENEFKQFDIIREDQDLPNMSYASAVVKMHGDFLRDNIVLTETDYYNYPNNFPLIRAFVQSIFATKLVLFIGFSFTDLNLKMILNEVRNILGEKMQRAYLISLNKPDALTIKYFEKRFVNIVNIDGSDIKLLLKGTNIPVSEESRLSQLPGLGRLLYDYLKVIQNADFNQAKNPISYVWNKLASYQDEMRVYGRGLKYFLPKNQGVFGWLEHSHGVQTFHPYFEDLAKLIKSPRGIYQFVDEVGRDNIKPLLKFAYYNSLDSIDKVVFLNDKFYNNIESYGIVSAIDRIDMYDFKGLAEKMKDLSRKSVIGEISDLEMGYIYYKLGDYYKAYLEFNKVLPVAWKKGKYILYFICLYNLYKLRYAVKTQLVLSDTIDGEVISERLCRINPSESLSRLQLPIEFRKIFQDLLSDRYLNEHLVDSEKLKEELHRQRISAEKGASSMNSNIVRLLGIYDRENKFCNYNFILSDFHSASIALKRNIVSGILNSHATKDSQESPWNFRNTKLETLNALTINILISSLPFTELRKTFKQYKITSLTLDDKAKDYVKNCISNMQKDSFVPFWCDLIKDRIINLLYIISLVEVKGIDIDVLYSIIKWLYSVPVVRINMSDYVPGIIKNNPPTPEIANEMLNFILKSENVENSLSTIVAALSDVISKSEIRLDVINCLKDSKFPKDLILPLANIVPQDKKSEYYSWAISQLKSDFIEYVLFIYSYKLVPENLDEFREGLMSYKTLFHSNYGTLGGIMSKFRKDSRYEDLWNIIDECATSLPYLKFALNPKDFEKPQDVNPEWIKGLDEDEVRELIKIPIYNDILLKHIAFGNFTSEDRLNLLSVYSYKDISDHNTF